MLLFNNIPHQLKHVPASISTTLSKPLPTLSLSLLQRKAPHLNGIWPVHLLGARNDGVDSFARWLIVAEDEVGFGTELRGDALEVVRNHKGTLTKVDVFIPATAR